jgi:hypothetical protein
MGMLVADVEKLRGAFVLVLVDADADAYLVSPQRKCALS